MEGVQCATHAYVHGGTGKFTHDPNQERASRSGSSYQANSRRGKQNATWSGSNIVAGNKAINPGDEIFIPYTTGRSYIMADEVDFDDEERVTGEEWYYVGRARRITNERSRAKTGITPAPLRGGEGGNLQAGDRVFQHVAGVSAPT